MKVLLLIIRETFAHHEHFRFLLDHCSSGGTPRMFCRDAQTGPLNIVMLCCRSGRRLVENDVSMSGEEMDTDILYLSI